MPFNQQNKTLSFEFKHCWITITKAWFSRLHRLSRNRKRKQTFAQWNIRFPVQNMNFSVDITKNNGIVPDGHGSNTVFKSGLVTLCDFFRVNYFNIHITRFSFFLQTLFKMVMWVATFSSEGYKIRSLFGQKSTYSNKTNNLCILGIIFYRVQEV